MNGTSNQNKFSASAFLAAENEFRPMLRVPDPFHVYKNLYGSGAGSSSSRITGSGVY